MQQPQVVKAQAPAQPEQLSFDAEEDTDGLFGKFGEAGDVVMDSSEVGADAGAAGARLIPPPPEPFPGAAPIAAAAKPKAAKGKAKAKGQGKPKAKAAQGAAFKKCLCCPVEVYPTKVYCKFHSATVDYIKRKMKILPKHEQTYLNKLEKQKKEETSDWIQMIMRVEMECPSLGEKKHRTVFQFVTFVRKHEES